MTSLPHPSPDLTTLTKIGSGKQRDVYLWPASPQDPLPMVLKVPHAERARRLSWSKRILRRLLPYSGRRVITKEAKYACKLADRHQDGAYIPIPSFCGYVDTPQGRGALWEAVCTRTGKPAPTLRDLARRGKITRRVTALNRFVATCFDNNIVASDLHAGNLVCVKRDGRQQVILIDGYGDHRMISLRALLRWYNRRCLLKRFERIALQTGLLFDAASRSFMLLHQSAMPGPSEAQDREEVTPDPPAWPDATAP